MKKIYLRNFKKTRKTTINDIINILTEPEYIFNVSSTYTINKKQSIIKHCSRGKSRSLNDIVNVIKTYFPNATTKTILKTLYNNIIEYNSKLLKKTDGRKLLIYCPDIKKIVVQNKWEFYLGKEPLETKLFWNCIYNYQDYLDYYYNKKVKGYSLKEFLILNGIDSDEIDTKFN